MRLRVGAALPPLRENERGWEEIVRHDPNNASALNNLAVARWRTAEVLLRLGRVADAMRKLEEGVGLEKQTPLTGFVARNLALWTMQLAAGHAMLGDAARAGATAAHARKLDEIAIRNSPALEAYAFGRALYECFGANVAALAGDGASATRRLRETLASIEAVRPEGELQERNRRRALMILNSCAARIAYRAGDLPGAQAFGAAAIAARAQLEARNPFEQLRLHEVDVHQAKVLSRLGRAAEARQLLQPALAFMNEHVGLGSDDVVLKVQLAHALLVQALLSPRERQQLLAQAAATMRRLPEEAVRWKEWSLLLEEIAAEQAKSSSR